MADTSLAFNITFAAGNGAKTVSDVATLLGPCHVRRILVTWPTGCAGLVGVQIKAGGSAAFPSNATQYMLFDGYTYDTAVTNQLDSGQWVVEGYNLDFLPHTIQVIYEFDYLGTSKASVAFTAVAL
jgi:hypothetical protein